VIGGHVTHLAPDQLGTILGVWAHPDDEAYLSAGLMALARDAGQRVVCVTATRGEQGTSDPVRWPPGRLGRRREFELCASLAALGVTEHQFLGYPDGGCTTADAGDAVRRIAAVMAGVIPDTVVTFGPDGLTGHADHRTVSAWTTAAHAQAAPHARLLYATTTAAFVERWHDLHAQFDIFLDPSLPLRTPTNEVALEIVLDDDLSDRKLVALRAQASQTDALSAALGEDRFRAWCAVESYVEAPQPAAPRARNAATQTF
jgi:LmbE family N-acetylglucosaminyl deacetylase